MTTYLTSHFTSALEGARWWRYALHRRPLLVGSLSVIAAVFILTWIATAPAYAADAAAAVDGLVDSNGVPASAYSALPISDGGAFGDIGGRINQWFAVTGWYLSHQMSVAILDVLVFVLSFDWIDWVAMPIVGLSTGIHMLLGDRAWVAIALATTGLVGGLYLMRGRMATGISEWLVAAIAAALLGGVLANPGGWLTAPGGGLDTATSWGREIANHVVTGEPGGQYTLSSAVAQPLVDLIVRQPFHHIAFGQGIAGDCLDVLNAALMSDRADDGAYVRDQVRSCEPAAAEYADTPRLEMLGTLIFSILGRAGINLPLAIGVMIVQLTIVFVLFDSLKLIVGLFIAMFPLSRRLAWTAGLGMLMGLLSLIVQVVLIAAYASIVVDITDAAAEAGMTYDQLQLAMVALFFALLVLLVMAAWRLRQQGKAMAATAAAWGSNALPPVSPLPVAAALAGAQRAAQLASSVATNRKLDGPTKAAPVTPTPVQQQAFFSSHYASPQPAMRYPAPTSPSTNAPGGGGTSTSPSAPSSGRRAIAPAAQEPLQATFERVGDQPPPRRRPSAREVAGGAGRVLLAAGTKGQAGAVVQGVSEVASIASKALPRRVQVDASTGVASITSLPSVPRALPPASPRPSSAASTALRQQLEAAKKPS